MIIDLDAKFRRPKKKAETPVSDIKPVERETKRPEPETFPDKKEISVPDRNDFLISQIEGEEKDVRYARALAHRKYFSLLNADLDPTGSAAEFLAIYEEIEGFTNQLKDLWMRKEHIRHFGKEQRPRTISNENMAKIDALKHARRRVNDNLYKARKQLSVAQAAGNHVKEANASVKIDQLQFKYLEIQTELKKLEEDV